MLRNIEFDSIVKKAVPVASAVGISLVGHIADYSTNVGTLPLPADLTNLSAPLPNFNPEVQINVGDLETVRAGGFTLKRVYGERDPDNSTNLLIVPQRATSFDNAINTAHIILRRSLSVKPLDSLPFTVWVLDPATTPDLGCEPVICKSELLYNLADRINSLSPSTGILMQEFLVWINRSGSADRSYLDAQFPGNVPTIKSFGMLLWYENRDHSALSAIGPHAIGHFVFNLTDERLDPRSFTNGNEIFNCLQDTSVWRGKPGDPGTKYEGCATQPKGYFRTAEDNIMGSGWEFSPLLTWWVENYAKLMPGNYQMPAFEVFRYRDHLNISPIGQGFPQGSLDLGFKAKIPYGTKYLSIELIPAADRETGVPNSPGVGPLNITDLRFIDKIRREGYIWPAPKLGVGPYVTLPGMSYTWRVRASNDPTVSFGDPRLNNLQVSPIKSIDNKPGIAPDASAPRGSEKITFPAFGSGETTNNLTPTLRWQNVDTDVFYYEVQVSKDPTFNTDPATAIAAVQDNLIHGGMSNPLNSYKSAPLEAGKTYYWRVRPRVQGDGIPVAWSNIASFKTSAEAKVLSERELEIIRIAEEIDWQAMQQDHNQAVTEAVMSQRILDRIDNSVRYSDPIYGVKPDAYYGDGVWGPSKEDLIKWGHVKQAAIIDDKGKIVELVAYKEENLEPAA